MSPDLPELWKDVKNAVWRSHPSNLSQLDHFAQAEWAKLPVGRCRSPIESYRGHLLAKIAPKGCARKY